MISTLPAFRPMYDTLSATATRLTKGRMPGWKVSEFDP
jgi:hypothetical protein